jgi:sterol desaturase/sphingolipid hydroxylase (fatty acid hydroxylase superfamily)
MMLQPLLSLTLGLEAILVVRTLVLIALVPPLVRMLPGAKAPTGPQSAQQTRRPEGHDIALSLGSSWIFALGGAVVIQADAMGLTRLIHDPGGRWWLAPLQFVGVLLLQDTIFYGLHRLLHHRLCYRWLHQGHHHSRHPTGWTAFAFDGGEALLQAGFLVGVVFLIPLQGATLMALLLTMSAWAVVNHLDPAQQGSAPRSERLGRWLIGPTHHGLHHLRPGRNFGLYFTFWDRICGTAEPSSS